MANTIMVRPVEGLYLCTLITMGIFNLGLSKEFPTTVKTNCGRMEGLYDSTDEGFVFKGIPYASPPVGKLRWKEPVPLEKSNCWNGILDATKFGNKCTQLDFATDEISGSEDCLYLNVWTPTLDTSAKLPVMVFIHGGYLLYASGNEGGYGYAPSTELAVTTNMVHVSFNYRLNAFGFMALQLLADDSPTKTSGNYGFMDQIEVLKWIQKNIASFGGDPNLVTVYGQSSGGTSIFALLASPLCQGLFHRAWMISGSPILNKSRDDAFTDNLVFLHKTGCDDVNCLYSLSKEHVINSIPWNVYPYWEMEDQGGLPSTTRFDGAIAIVDGNVLQYPPFDAWTKGVIVDVPLIVGTTGQETEPGVSPAEVLNWTSQEYENHVRESLSPFSDVIAEMALKLYPSNKNTPQFQLASMTGDMRMGCGNDYLTLIAAASFKSPVYRYVATFIPPQPVRPFDSQPTQSAFHNIDTFAFFGTLDVLGYNLTDRDHRWINNVRQEMTQFVKTGRPFTESWKTYPEVTALLSDYTTVSSGYHRAECQFWLTNGFFSYSWIN